MSSFWRLLRYIRRYKAQVALNIGSNVLTAVFTALSIPLLIPFLNILFGREALVVEQPEWAWRVEAIAATLNYHLSQVVLESRERALGYVCAAILSVFFLKNLFRYLSLFFMAPVRNGIIRDIRQQLFEKILVLPLSYFSEERKGDLLARTTADAQEVESSVLNVLEVVFREPIIIAGALGFMLYVSPPLTLFVFVLMLFTGVVIGGVGRTLKRSSGEVQGRLGNLVSILDEALSGLRIIRGFNAEGYQRGKFGRENDDYRHALTRLLWRRDLASPLSEFMGIGTVAVLLWYGSRLVFSGGLAAETFLTFIFAFYNVIDPAKSFSKASYDIRKGLAAMNRIEQVLDAPVTIADPAAPLPLEGFHQDIEYRHVGFRYRPDEPPVLQDVCLRIPKGATVALVGVSGAGKTTLADLLPRFHDVTEGGIFLDGTDIRHVRLHDLRRLMGIVSQEAVLFNDTIYNNIVFGTEGVHAADVERAARIAHAHDFIMATEEGYATYLGERGVRLSGGQRQRIAIARAMLKNPPLLLLDEATSALDAESERMVQRALDAAMADRTTVVIAHRLATVLKADRIVVMDAGRIVDSGTHDELVARGGLYARLAAMQFGLSEGQGPDEGAGDTPLPVALQLG